MTTHRPSTMSGGIPGTGQPLSNEPDTIYPADEAAEALAALAAKLRAADDAYNKADRTRREAFAIAYDSGAMTLKQIGDAVGRTPGGIRTLIEGYSDRSTGKARAAADALEQLGG